VNPDHIIAMKYASRLRDEFTNQDKISLDELESYATEILREAIWEAVHDINAEGLALMKVFHDALCGILGHEEIHRRVEEIRSKWTN
jgi:hypothetical protein